MNKILASLLICTWGSVVHAEPVILNKAIACSPKEEIKTYIESYDLKLLFLGTSYDEITSPSTRQYNAFELTSTFWVNQDTGNWSFISISVDGVACLISFGENFSPYIGSESDQDNILPNASK